jgi:hypothetical protein
MKDIDFLPEWYKEGRRRRLHMRRQYVVLAVFFLVMVTYNTLATHRISKASAELNRLEDRRFWAEGILYEYDAVSEQLSARQAKVATVQQADARIDVAAVLAEISYVIGDGVVLKRLDFISEPLASDEKTTDRPEAAVRTAPSSRASTTTGSLGPVRFRLALAGIAVDSAEVGALVCRLEDSLYFQQVRPLNTIQIGTSGTESPSARRDAIPSKDRASVSGTEFEITCYLANYEQ